jgi:hypothetical protein
LIWSKLDWGYKLILLVSLSLLGAGCAAFEDPSHRATANAENTIIASTLSMVELQQETMVSLQATADSAVKFSAQLTQVNSERNALRATLGGASANTGAGGGNPNTTGGVVIRGTPNPGATPSTLDGGVPAGTGPSPTPALSPNIPAFENARTTSDLTADSCAINNQSTFSQSNNIIYFVVVARNLQAGTDFSLKITQDGVLRNRHVSFWVSDAFYETTCVYYGIDRQNIPDFEPGNYTVELLVGEEVVAWSNFVIR